MSGNISVYSFDKVVCLMNGAPIVDYFEGDDVIKVTRGDDAVRAIIGADGNAIINVSTDLSAVIELKLKPSSVSNTVLQALELNFRRGLRVLPVPFVLTDYQTAEVYTSSTAVVMSRPKDIQFGKLATARTWMIFCGCLTEGTIGQI